jgi:hypothetical protein
MEGMETENDSLEVGKSRIETPLTVRPSCTIGVGRPIGAYPVKSQPVELSSTSQWVRFGMGGTSAKFD